MAAQHPGAQSEPGPASTDPASHSTLRPDTVNKKPLEPVLEEDKFVSNNEETNNPKMKVSSGSGRITKMTIKRENFSINSIMARLSNKVRGQEKGLRTEASVPPVEEGSMQEKVSNATAVAGTLQGEEIVFNEQKTHNSNNLNVKRVPVPSGQVMTINQEGYVLGSQVTPVVQRSHTPQGDRTTSLESAVANLAETLSRPVSSQGERVGNRSDEQSTSVAGTKPANSGFQYTAEAITDRAAALKVGDSFSTWSELKAVLDEFQRINKVRLSKRYSTTVEARNKTYSASVKKHPSEHVYANAHFGCIHSGKARCRGTGIRVNQSTIKLECPARIYVISDRARQKLVIKAFNNNHNHELTDKRIKIPTQQCSYDDMCRLLFCSEPGPASMVPTSHSTLRPDAVLNEKPLEPVLEEDKFVSNEETNNPKMEVLSGSGRNTKIMRKQKNFSIMARLSNKDRQEKGLRTEASVPPVEEGSMQEKAIDMISGMHGVSNATAVAGTLQGEEIVFNEQKTHDSNNLNVKRVPVPSGQVMTISQEGYVLGSQVTPVVQRSHTPQEDPTTSVESAVANLAETLSRPVSSQDERVENRSDEQSTSVAGAKPASSGFQYTAETITDRAATLKVGDSFSTWSELKAVLDEFQRINKVRLSKRKSATVEARNKTYSASVKKHPSEHVYANAHFGCIHSGKARCRGTGIRVNQSTTKLECPARIYVISDRAQQKLVIRAINNHHNHELTDEIFKIPTQQWSYGYPPSETCKPKKLKMDVNIFRQHVYDTSGELAAVTDLHRLRSSLGSEETEVDTVFHVLQDFLTKHKGGKLAFVVGDDGSLEGIFLQTLPMGTAFSNYPEILYLDSAHSKNMHLFTVSVVDGVGTAMQAGHVLFLDQTKASSVRALQMFKQHSPHYGSVATVVIDRLQDASEVATVAHQLHDKIVVVCHFRAMEAQAAASSHYVKNPIIHEKVLHLIRRLAYSTTERCYYDAYAELLALEGAEEFGQYFLESWHGIRTLWVKVWVAPYANLDSHDERRHETLDKLLRETVALSQLVKNLLLSSATNLKQTDVQASNQQLKAIKKAYKEACTVDASKLIYAQLSQAKSGKYKITTKEDGTLSVSTVNGTHAVNSTCSECSCGCSKSMGIPCSHIFAARKKRALDLFDLSLVAECWLKTSKPHAEKGEHQEPNVVTSEALLPPEPMSREAKYQEVLDLSKEIAEVVSLCGETEYSQCLQQMRCLLNHYKSHKPVQVTCTSPQDKDCVPTSYSPQALSADHEVTEASNFLLQAMQDGYEVCRPLSEDNPIGTTSTGTSDLEAPYASHEITVVTETTDPDAGQHQQENNCAPSENKKDNLKVTDDHKLLHDSHEITHSADTNIKEKTDKAYLQTTSTFSNEASSRSIFIDGVRVITVGPKLSSENVQAIKKKLQTNVSESPEDTVSMSESCQTVPAGQRSHQASLMDREKHVGVTVVPRITGEKRHAESENTESTQPKKPRDADFS
ncbi:PREDICTED: uncharacterized protein LOC109470341 [Branchiostoma belcheri]|uniref:Uncharacterized protein LOC109470341 n=1 Tax=Branchiostoma belcheri TaxID=7741 RepID=A0A6P4Z5E6_BRABE|nr:PREDICTED: uncharacterized protein LOC109470341 [Branchiostoma belcheri]